MATQLKTPQQEALGRAIERGRKEIAEARRLYGGDPNYDLDNAARQIYDEEMLRQMLKYLLERRSDWDDEEDELADAE